MNGRSLRTRSRSPKRFGGRTEGRSRVSSEISTGTRSSRSGVGPAGRSRKVHNRPASTFQAAMAVGAGGPKSEISFLSDFPLARAALEYAAAGHRGQRREGDLAGFVLHPLEVASLLARSGYPDHVIAAALLHDVIEDTPVDPDELEAAFGQEVRELVTTVSDDPEVPDEETRKDELRERVRDAGGYAAAVYAADKISKVRELRIVLARQGTDAAVARKIERHRKSLEMLEQTIPESRLVELLRFELESLMSLPPGSA